MNDRDRNRVALNTFTLRVRYQPCDSSEIERAIACIAERLNALEAADGRNREDIGHLQGSVAELVSLVVDDQPAVQSVPQEIKPRGMDADGVPSPECPVWTDQCDRCAHATRNHGLCTQHLRYPNPESACPPSGVCDKPGRFTHREKGGE